MLACGKALTVSDMLAEFECIKGMSNQKVSALVRKLKDAGKVEKSVEGRKSFFKALA
jgi:DNA-binding transcriptional regulator GbsR (MarR family)